MSQSPTAPTPQLGFLLHDAARLMRKRFEQRARSAGLNLSRSQWQLLAVLKRNEGIQQGALADLMDIEPITLVRLVDRCQSAGMVERHPDPKDRRAWRLFLKPEAHPVLELMHSIGSATREEALARISAADRDVLFRILETVRADLADACARPAADEGPEIRHA